MVEFDEDRYLDVLQNIEVAAIEVYRSDPELVDGEVEKALSGLITAYNARKNGKSLDLASLRLNERSEKVFRAVYEICEWRLGSGSSSPSHPEVRSLTEVVACLQRVRKSVRRWTKERGRRGYLNFVQEYLP